MRIEPVHHVCAIHLDCYVYWRPDPARNRLRGRVIHVRSWTLFDGRLMGGFGVFKFSGWKRSDETMVKLPDVTVPFLPVRRYDEN